jgi:hypothetical protein
MTASRALLGGAWLLGMLLSGGAAYAQPSAAQKETARGLMAEGRELRERGDLNGALTRFSAADSLMGVPTTGFEVASTQAQLGRLVEARETLRHVLAIAQSPDDPEPFNEARSKARALDQQLLPRIGGLRFSISGVGANEAIEVTVDGEVVPKALVSLPLRVNPGAHVVAARAGSRQVKREVVVAEAQTVAVGLAFQNDAQPSPPHAPATEAGAPPAAPRPSPVADTSPKPGRRGLPTLAYVGGGVALAGVAVGSIAGISAISHKNDAKKACVNGTCPPSTWSDLDSAHSMATVSTVGFIAGAIGVVVGAGAVLLDGDEPSAAQGAFVVSPEVNRQGARLTIAGRF